MKKEQIFKRLPERQSEADYFLDSFPSMPEKSGLFHAMDGITYMSDEGIIYYLPFFMECLLEDPYPYDRLNIIVDSKLSRMSVASEERYRDELALARHQMDEVNRKFY